MVLISVSLKTKDGDFLLKRILTGMLSAVLVAGSAAAITGCSSGSSNSPDSKSDTESVDYKPAEEIKDGSILQCFCWSFNTIKESMADIAAAGFSAVQTSPINECLVGEDGGMELYGDGKWYYHYQPTDFTIGNYQVGTRDEFKAMCDEADKYGIKVIVDVIANHTTPTKSEVSQSLIDAGGGSLNTLYHSNGSKPLNNYGNRLDCTTYEMGGLPDINTERPSFQDYFIAYINDCIACGADGFRYDTAKHIGLPDDPKENDGFENNFWERVTTEITDADRIFNYGEVLQGNNERLGDYVKAIGHTTSSTYGSKIRSAITNKFLGAATVEDYWIGSDVDPANIVTWVESHDNYINDGTAYSLTNDQVILGWAIITSRKDGTPLFFDRPYQASMENEWGMNRIGTQGDDMYKDSRVKAANFFRIAMKGEDEKLVNPNKDNSAVIIERGDKGAVIVNTEGELSTGFEINLPDGKYTDRVSNTTVYTVKDGVLTSDSAIPENSVVVLYNEGYVNYAKTAEVGVASDSKFEIDADEQEITLTCANTDNATYSVNGGEAVKYSDGDVIKITPDDDKVTSVELRAENSKGIKTYKLLEFTFKKNYIVNSGSKIYFEKPADWDDEIYAYVYDSDLDENDSWPGELMTKESNGLYSYKFAYDWVTPYIIFNDGDAADSSQFPKGQGLMVEPDKTYKVE